MIPNTPTIDATDLLNVQAHTVASLNAKLLERPRDLVCASLELVIRDSCAVTANSLLRRQAIRRVTQKMLQQISHRGAPLCRHWRAGPRHSPNSPAIKFFWISLVPE